MTTEEDARWKTLAETLARVERRQQEIERRLERLEARGAVERRAEPLGKNFGQPVEQQAAAVPATGQAGGPAPPRNIEAAFGLTWVSRIAVVTVVLALAFFFEYAFERRWITETGRVLLAAGFGAVALAFGERFWRVGQAAYGQALTAAGIAFLYLSFWASFGLYHLIGRPAAFGLMTLATAAAGALALRYSAPAVAALGLAAGFATPLLLGGAQDPWSVLGYALILDCGAAFAARAQRWRWLEAMAIAGTVALYVSQLPMPEGLPWLYTFFVLACYGLFAASGSAPVVVAAEVIAPVALAGIWAPGAEALWAALLVAGAGLVVADRRGWAAAVTGSFAGFWLAYSVWRFLGQATFVGPVSALTASYLLFLAWPVWRALGRGQALRFQDLLTAAINPAVFFGAVYALLPGRHGGWAGALAIGTAAAQIGAARALWRKDGRGSALAAGAAAVLLVLAAPAQFVGYRITVAWAMEGAALVWLGERLREPRAARAAAAVFLLVAARLALLDSRMYPWPGQYAVVGNARLLAFAAAAAALWAAARWLRSKRAALAAFIAGHGALLSGLGLETAAWAERTAAPQNVRSATSMSISVLIAAYSVLLVAIGAARRNAPTRVVGIALISAVVAKLYVYDIWLLGPFYRMAAFGILGALLWVMAYLYSRFRGSIGNWWRS